MIFVIPLFFMATLISQPWSADKRITVEDSQPAATVKPVKPVKILKCPKGWHKKPGSTYPMISCVPDVPPPLECPDNTEYYGCQNPNKCCEVGCGPVKPK